MLIIENTASDLEANGFVIGLAYSLPLFVELGIDVVRLL